MCSSPPMSPSIVTAMIHSWMMTKVPMSTVIAVMSGRPCFRVSTSGLLGDGEDVAALLLETDAGQRSRRWAGGRPPVDRREPAVVARAEETLGLGLVDDGARQVRAHL